MFGQGAAGGRREALKQCGFIGVKKNKKVSYDRY